MQHVLQEMMMKWDSLFPAGYERWLYIAIYAAVKKDGHIMALQMK